MNDNATGPIFHTVTLDTPIIKGDTTIDTLQLRKPRSGELRGLTLVDLGQLKVDALIKIVPRIAMPTITEVDVANLDTADLLAIGTEIGGFLLQKSHRADALAQ
ncbi:phage tail assembly protein [Sphingobium yanoikuyae]|uniref:Phage tail assembly protein n=1 Tax=Sphingobium yanoikuyae TaxID=13690 RepID=A0A430BCK3_SPHYA|nr:phage tail assembly protein [Sphingobium yanoikuyae]RSU46237.1 phage tail assembly protein [Sphingobium yanoikuyae]WBQ15962.1 phage tail assembly protein [Sphingobium yanoikuyae]